MPLILEEPPKPLPRGQNPFCGNNNMILSVAIMLMVTLARFVDLCGKVLRPLLVAGGPYLYIYIERERCI